MVLCLAGFFFFRSCVSLNIEMNYTINRFLHSLIVASVVFFLGCSDEKQSFSKATALGGSPEGQAIALSAKISSKNVMEGSVFVIEVALGARSSKDLVLSWEILQHKERFLANAGSMTVVAGNLSSEIQIQLLKDSLYNGPATFDLVIKSVDPTDPVIPLTLTLNAVDGDAMPFLSVLDASALVGSPVRFFAQLSAASGADTQVSYSTYDATAKSSVHYVAQKGQVVIPKGMLSVPIEVPTIGTSLDGSMNPSVFFSVQLENVQNAQLIDGSATGTILKTISSEAQVSFRQDVLSVAEGAGFADVIVELSQAQSVDVTVSVDAVGGTAVLSKDFTLPSKTLTIPAGSTSGVFKVAIIQDVDYEKSETIILKILSSSNAVIGAISEQTLTVLDDDPLPKLTVADVIATEGDNLVFTFKLDRPSGVDAQFTFKTNEDSADATDFEMTLKTISIPAGTTVVSVAISTFTDDLYEQTEKFSVVVLNVKEVSLGTNQASGYILDNDPKPLVSFDVASKNVVSVGDAAIQIVLNKPSGTATYVTLNVAGNSVPGVDHNLTSQLVTLPKGVASVSVPFQVYKIGTAAQAKTIILQLSQATAAEIGQPAQQVVHLGP